MSQEKRVHSLRENSTGDDLSSKTMSGATELRTLDSEITKLSRKVRKIPLFRPCATPTSESTAPATLMNVHVEHVHSSFRVAPSPLGGARDGAGTSSVDRDRGVSSALGANASDGIRAFIGGGGGTACAGRRR